MDRETLQQLFVDQIRDLYDAEKQIAKALPILARASESGELAQALRDHLEETQGHVTRLERVFKIASATPKAKACKGMRGIIEEGNEDVQNEDRGALRDLAIISGRQRAEHYEISAYGTARTLAERLGMNDAATLLQQTEDEEKHADERLTEVAQGIYEASGGEEGQEAERVMVAGSSSSRSSSPARSRVRKSSR